MTSTTTTSTPETVDDPVLTGAQFRDFWQNHWPKGWYVEDMPLHIEDDLGRFVLSDTAQIRLSDAGYAYWDGSDEGRQFLQSEEEKGYGLPMNVFYARVMGQGSAYKIMSLKVPQDKIDAVKTFAAHHGLEFFV